MNILISKIQAGIEIKVTLTKRLEHQPKTYKLNNTL